jgi:hypothetical protein
VVDRAGIVQRGSILARMNLARWPLPFPASRQTRIRIGMVLYSRERIGEGTIECASLDTTFMRRPGSSGCGVAGTRKLTIG